MYPCFWGLLVAGRGSWAGSVWLWRGGWDAAFPSLCCSSLISCVLPSDPTYRCETWLAFDQMWLWVKPCNVKGVLSLCYPLFYCCFVWILISFVLDRREWGKAKSTTKEGKGKAIQTHQSLKAAQARVLELGCCGCWSTVDRFLSLLLPL